MYRAGGEVEWPSGSSDVGVDPFADLERRQPALVVAVLRLVVTALLVRGEEAAERDHGARGAELGVAPVRRGRAEP